MKIKVIYPNRVGYVDSAELDELIRNGEIMAFERSKKLVFIGLHPVRERQGKGSPPGHHPERREKTTR